jgi:hypothetical protein
MKPAAVEDVDLLLAMIQSTTEDTPHKEIVDIIGVVRKELSTLEATLRQELVKGVKMLPSYEKEPPYFVKKADVIKLIKES